MLHSHTQSFAHGTIGFSHLYHDS